MAHSTSSQPQPLNARSNASVGGIVYAVVALTINAAGVRDIAQNLLQKYRARGATA